MKREPLQHILGSQPSRHITVRVTADAMVPRPGTEFLVEGALDLFPHDARRPLAVDLGTGTGCIACAIASERPDVEVIALDASPRAAMLARENVAALGLSARVAVEVSELFSALGERRADVIVSNPPYLPTSLIATLTPEVRQYDPRGALDGGPDGLRVIRRIVAEAPQRLLAGGAPALETSAAPQGRPGGGPLAEAGVAAGGTRAAPA